MPKIFLVGMPGCGKTYLGKRIAKKLGLDFVDLDEVIIGIAGKAITEIFLSEGEDYFRQLEAESLREISINHQDFVMATGGGAPCFHQNMEFINHQGISLFVNLSLEIIADSLLAKGIHERPLLKDFNKTTLLGELQEKFSKRIKFYSQAKVIVNLEKRDPEKVEQALENYLLDYL
jgi:shikimate kinase